MEQGTYKGDVLQKVAGLSFIVGAILLAVFAVLNPGGGPDDIDDVIQTIADNNGGFWQIDHILIAVAFFNAHDRNSRGVSFHLLRGSCGVGAHRLVRNDCRDRATGSLLGI